jgi:ankyrin repeat protein
MSKRERDGDGMTETPMDEAQQAQSIEDFLAAVKCGDAKAVRAALASDGDLVCLEDSDTLWSPLHHAVKGAHLDVVRELLKKGADVEAVTHHQSTALHIAACNGGACATPEAAVSLERIVTLLIDRGCPLSAVDNKLNTALHRAAQHGSFGICRTLWMVVGDDGSRNADGQTVTERAIAGGHEKIVAFIRQQQAGPSRS